MRTETNDLRAEQLYDLEGLVTFLAQNGDVPLNRHGHEIHYHVGGMDDRHGIEEIERIAALLGVEVTVNAKKTHYTAQLRIGTATYEAVYVVQQEMSDWRELMAIGEERKAQAVTS